MSDEKRVDEDWKKRAQIEKEQDAAKAGGAPAARPRRGGRPPADFMALVESLASQALLFMGAMRDPVTGESHQDLRQAQAMIDILEMLEEKTKGNLAKEESEGLRQVLDELRMNFVRLTSPPSPRGPMMGNAPRP